MNYKQINGKGINQIIAFLGKYHQEGEEISKDYGFIKALAKEAEESNRPTIEIKPWESVSGKLEILTIGPEAFDVIDD